MRTLPAGLAAHLATGTTTLAWCWRLTRRDGVTLGFTDHDVDIAFDGTTFEAAAGFTASEMKAAVGLGVDNLEVESALSSGRLEENDLAAGVYDDALVEIVRVNWQAPDQRVHARHALHPDCERHRRHRQQPFRDRRDGQRDPNLHHEQERMAANPPH